MKSSVLLPLAVFLAVAETCFASNHTEQGWQQLLKNNEQAAIESFEKAVADDPTNVRAYLGLSFAYGLQVNDEKSWEAYRKALIAAPDPFPYIYAAQYSRRFTVNMYNPKSGIEDILEDILNKQDSTGILRAMILELLGNMREHRGNISEARSMFSQIGFITSWRLIGPFDNISSSGYDTPYPPEMEDNPNAVYSGADLRKVRYFTPPHSRNDGWIDFARHFESVQGVFYARCYIRSDSTQRVQFRIGTSGAFRLFLNDALVSDTVDEHNNDLDTYITELTLQRGWNNVLVKMCNSKLERCNFLFRITNASGVPISGLGFSTDPQVYNKASANPVRLPNPFVKYFRTLLEQNPSHIENALLLIESHLRNDEVESAEEVIDTYLQQHPDFIAGLMLALDAYQRGSRNDLTISTVEHITSLRPDLPISLVYAFRNALSSRLLDSADVYLERIKERLPESIDYYDGAIAMARLRNNPGLVVDLQARAYERHKGEVSYAAAAATVAMRSAGGHAAALAIAEEHLSHNWSEYGLLLKASILEESARYEQWEQTYVDLFNLSPCSPGYHSRKAESYARRKMWSQALASTQSALKDAPSVSWLWYASGTYRKTLNDFTGAGDDFRRAIDADPANFDAREALRELEGRPSPFSVMKRNNIDSMMRTAPNTIQLPNEKAVVLLEDYQRVVHDGSRCEVRYEFLVRVLTLEGIDGYKDMYLPGPDYSTVEKAVIVKSSGREIPADRNGNRAVFKNLEISDFIYVRLRWQEHTRGKLAGYFTDEVAMNSDVPVKISRYSLLSLNNEPYSWRFLNGEIKNWVSETPLGTLHVWELLDEPAIRPEEEMPAYWDISKSLEISSIPRWQEIVLWYNDLSRTKTRTSLEIRKKMNEMFPPENTYSEREIIEGVYSFITQEIRYSYVPFRQSGYIPQSARDVLVTRIGDCKDVATLCISMLAERGITAYSVLVRTNTHVWQKTPLPSVAFDHVIVMVPIDSSYLFMDLTAEDYPLGTVPFSDLNSQALLVRPGEMGLFILEPKYFLPNVMNLTTHIELHDDLGARITQRFTQTGARTAFFRGRWKGASTTDLERWLLEGLSIDMPDVRLVDYTIPDVNQLTPTLEYSITFDVPDFVMEASDLKIIRLPWYSPYEPTPALSYEQRKYTYSFTRYVDTLTEIITLVLPPGYETLGLKSQEVFTSPIASVVKAASEQQSVVTIKRTSVNNRTFVEPQEYQNYKSFYNNVARSDRQSLLFVPKGTVIQRQKQKTTLRKSSK